MLEEEIEQRARRVCAIMLEKKIEQRVCDYAKSKHGALVYKFTSPQRVNVPDRLFLLPDGRCFFIEFKAEGKVPNGGQLREHQRLKEQGHTVYVVDNIDYGKQVVDFEYR